MKELFLTLGVFGILTVGLLAFFMRLISRAVKRGIAEESLTPQDLLALQSAADELVRRIEEAADSAIARLEAKEREVGELPRNRDAVILSSSNLLDDEMEPKCRHS